MRAVGNNLDIPVAARDIAKIFLSSVDVKITLDLLLRPAGGIFKDIVVVWRGLQRRLEEVRVELGIL